MAAIIYLDIAKMPGEDGNVCVHSFTVNPLATDNKWKDNYEVAGPTDTARLKVAELCRVAEEIELPNGSQIIVFTTNRHGRRQPFYLTARTRTRSEHRPVAEAQSTVPGTRMAGIIRHGRHLV